MTPPVIYTKMLNEQGLLVRPDGSGRLHFKYEGNEYTLLTYVDDPQFVRSSATYALPAGTRRPKAITEANGLTQCSKVAKVYLLPNRGVAISAELFVTDPHHLEALLLRLIRLVQSVANDFFNRLTADSV